MKCTHIENEKMTTTLDVACAYVCECRPGFQYKSKGALDTHKKSKMHTAYLVANDLKHTQVRSKDFENRIERMKYALEQQTDVERELLARIVQLNKENEWLRTELKSTYKVLQNKAKIL